MSPKFLLFGTGIESNYGCEAIVRGTERIIHHRFPESEVWYPSWSLRTKKRGKTLGDHSEIIVKDGWGSNRIPYISRRIFEKFGLLKPKIVNIPKALVKKSDCVLSIGGDLYTFANKETNWPFPYPIMEAGNEIIRSGKPYILWCASVGPLEKAGKRLNEIIEHLKACRAIIVREQGSFSYLRETIGLKDNVFLAADPAFLMEPESFELPFLRETGAQKLVAVNFSLAPIEHVYGKMPVETIQEKLALNVSQLLDNLPIRVLFVPHVRGDHKLLTPIFEKINGKYLERVGILPENIGAPKTKWIVSQANVLVSMRFHCALAGFSTTTPTIVLVSTTKGTKICEDMYGNLDFGLNIRDMDTDIVVSRIKEILDNEAAVRKKLKASYQMMQARALSAADVLAKVLSFTA